MNLFETEEGDKWVCSICTNEKEEEIKDKNWEYIFDSDDPVLRCALCGHGEYDYGS